mgnify:CR=1 FL=1
MDSNTIKVVTVPVGDLLSMITNAVNTEIEKLVNNGAGSLEHVDIAHVAASGHASCTSS